ncbi:chlorite dismutase family protein [Dehalococcoidia bacterium]|nr:chlorite dismutase family protein [Dehalococcoidia bacterium]
MGKDGRQYVRYSFYKVAREWRSLESSVKAAHRQEFATVLAEFSDQMVIRSYSTVGTRADTDLALWTVAHELDQFRSLTAQLFSTGLGPFLDTTYSYLALTRKSVYIEKHAHLRQEANRLTIEPQGSKYLFVYPFVKTREWYLLPQEDRQSMMNTHIAVGHKYPSIKINTSYSFGLDDQDFVLSFEGDEPADFLDLVMELRETQASKYTVRDTPIFTCTLMDIEDALKDIGE